MGSGVELDLIALFKACFGMRCTPVSFAVEIVSTALLLRKAQPQLPAIELLDRAMRGRYGRSIDFGEFAVPPSPFAYLVAEALDGGMQRSDWEGLWRSGQRPNGHPKVRPFLLQVWAEDVWPKFIVRYSLYGNP